LENLKLQGNSVALYFENVVGNAFEQSFTGIITGTMTAKQAFSSFAQSIVQDIAKIIAEEVKSKIISGLISGLMGAFTAGAGAGAAPEAGAATSGTLSTSGLQGSSALSGSSMGFSFASEKGNVFQFANGGIPDVGDKLQYFPMANGGIGSLRENGYEAIMPLARDSNGRLGVKSSGDSGQNSGNVYNISVNVQGNNNQSGHEQGQQIADAIIRSIAKDEIYKAGRNNNVKRQMSM